MEEKKTLCLEALFADQTAQFLTPYEVHAHDVVTFRFRTLKDNADQVILQGRGIRRTMKKAYSKGRFDFYEVNVVMGEAAFSYYFEILFGEERCIYDKMGVSSGFQRLEGNYFKLYPDFETPEWAKGAVMYQIFTDRFCNGDPENDVLSGEYRYLNKEVERVTNWNDVPRETDVHRFYGGDLQGVMQKLDYLQHLGVEAIYFNPLFVSPSNHKYDSQDYDYIDPHFVGFVNDKGELLPEGSEDNRESARYMNRVTDKKNLENANRYFQKLVEEAHKRNIRVILDGVFNHCGSFNKWMDAEKIYDGKPGYKPGAFVSKDSPYKDYFIFDDEEAWPDNEEYVGWWGYKTLPKLNYEGSRSLYRYVMNVATKWLKPPYNVDGWRLDVAADLGQSSQFNHKFWKDFRKTVKEEKKDALILAEHYGSPGHWLRGDEWDSVMNYDAFMEPVGYFLTGMEKHSDEYRPGLLNNGGAFFNMMRVTMKRFPAPALLVAMNELSNHDHSRFMTRTNKTVGRLSTKGAYAAGENVDPAVFKEAVVMQFTLPGAPTIYYGDETGVVGWTDPDSRRTYPWGQEDFKLIAFHKDMIRIHKTYSCLRTGSYYPLDYDYGYLAYARFDKRNAVITLVNNTDYDMYRDVMVWKIGTEENVKLHRIMQTNREFYNVGQLPCEIQDGILHAHIPARSAEVFAIEF